MFIGREEKIGLVPPLPVARHVIEVRTVHDVIVHKQPDKVVEVSAEIKHAVCFYEEVHGD